MTLQEGTRPRASNIYIVRLLQVVKTMRTLGVTLLVICLTVAVGYCDTVYYRTADGSWASMEAAVEDGRLHIEIGPQAAPNGEAVLVINKPEWMVLDDTDAPTLLGLKVNGEARPTSTDTLQLGCLSGDTADVVIGVKDDKNPIDAAGASFRLGDAHDVTVEVDTSGLGPPKTSGRMVVKMSGVQAGQYQGTLRLSDMAPLSNSRSWPVSFTVMGISVSDDKQSVSLAGLGAGYLMATGTKEQQLLLPNGLWAKLTSNMGGTYLYPREFTDVEIIKDTEQEKTVLVTANVVDLEDNPTEGLGKLEYELTVRSDTPALLVTTRSINISDKDISNSPNWGWLPCPYYCTPEGQQEWSSGGDKARYSTIGKVGWLWLAPRTEGQPGLLWVSADSFGEFMGGSILLYGSGGTTKPGEFVAMKLAFAPADSPAEAEQIYEDLVAKGLVTPVEKGE